MLTDGEGISLEELPDFLWKNEAPDEVAGSEPMSLREQPETRASGELTLDEAINRASKNALVRALREAGGNCHRAAQLLGVSRYTVYRMITRYGLVRRDRNGIGLQAISAQA
jgi:transcriptional regulator of acetoin/glycerol metabolism